MERRQAATDRICSGDGEGDGGEIGEVGTEAPRHDFVDVAVGMSLNDAGIRLFFDTAPASGFDTRRHRVTREIGRLATDHRFPGEPRPLSHPAALAMLQAEAERDGKTTLARRFHRSSTSLDAKLLARAVRAHRHVENRPHRVMDVVFHDDLMRLRTEHGSNIAVIRHAALNLVGAIPDKASLAVRRKTSAETTNTSSNPSQAAAGLQAIPLQSG